MKTQQGFTLIELVMVIVLIGILAATAIPKFIDLSNEAELASLNGIAGTLSSGSTINYASRSANVALGVPITDCVDVAGTLQGGLPAGFSINTPQLIAAGTVDSTCQVTDGTNTVNFTGMGIL